MLSRRDGCGSLDGRSGPGAERHHGSDDVALLQRAARILASRDGGGVARVEADEHQLAAARPAAGDEAHAARHAQQRHRHRRTRARRRRDRGSDRRAVAADHVGRAIDDQLWRIDRVEMQAGGVAALTLGRRRQGEPIRPAQRVPVGDMKRQREHARRPPGEFGEQRLRRRTRRAPLRGEQFRHHRAAGRVVRAGRRHDADRRNHHRPCCRCAHWPLRSVRGDSRAPPALRRGGILVADRLIRAAPVQVG